MQSGLASQAARQATAPTVAVAEPLFITRSSCHPIDWSGQAAAPVVSWQLNPCSQGALVGALVGPRVGEWLGARVGELLGTRVGELLGACVGELLGARVGELLGACVGEWLGAGVL